MPALDYPEPMIRLIAMLRGLPGIGPRSAERLVLWLVEQGPTRSGPLATAMIGLAEGVTDCDECGFFVEKGKGCLLCSNVERDGSLICVVEQAADVLRLERSGAYRGLYHVLGGKLSPLDNVTPEDLKIDSLLPRVRRAAVTEVILAVGSDVEGEATASFVADLLHADGIGVTRLAQGLPAGGALDHVDELTLSQALRGRTIMGRRS